MKGKFFKIALPLLFGGAILYWMYRDFDFRHVGDVMLHEMDWTWMLLSLPFGILAQMFRGIRWRQTLEPLGEHSRTSTRVNAVFLSYATSLVVPRIGEFVRCGVLRRKDGVSFPKALGTVVTERAIDTLLMLFMVGLTLLIQLPVFADFFSKTGTSISGFFAKFSTAGWIVTALCGIVAVVFLWWLVRKMSLEESDKREGRSKNAPYIYNNVKKSLCGIWQGVISLKDMRRPWLFIALTLAIWASYFVHYYLTFFCFDFTAHLGLSCALVTFVVGSIAVIVPTPNGAGPWHFAVKSMLILYGVADEQALYFVLIVHTVQTLLVALLGIYAWIRMMFIEKIQPLNTNQTT